MRRTEEIYDRTFDAIVIGSGLGGLTTASLLAQLEHKRVLVLERHFKLGGFTHAFTRPGRFTWDPGVHYIGDMDEGRPSRRMFDLVTGGAVGWRRLPDHYDRFVYPDIDFKVPRHPQAYRNALVEQFPEEADGIDAYFGEVKGAVRWAMRTMGARLLPRTPAALIRRLGARKGLRTTAEVLDEHLRDPRLKALVASQWGDYGLPPSRSAFAIHALVVAHYLYGAFYPDRGAATIAEAVEPIVETAGGACLVNHEVTSIVLENGRAVGVRVDTRDGEIELRAPLVVSDAGAAVTYGRLLPDLGLPAQDLVRRVTSPTTCVTLYLGLSGDPRHLDTSGENHWVFTGYDHDGAFGARDRLLDGDPVAGFVSFPSVRAGHTDAHTAEVIAFADYEPFARWQDRRWRRRGGDYEVLKERIGDGLLGLADRHIPGLADLATYREVSTPLSVEHLGGHPRGGIYGVPATPDAFVTPDLGPRTPVRGLLLSGADAASVGVVGALMGGAFAAATAMGVTGFPRIARAASRAPSAGPPRDMEPVASKTDTRALVS